MAKVNWYIAAKSSENEEVKELLIKYEKAKEDQKKEIRDRIIKVLTPQKSEKKEEVKKDEEKIEKTDVEEEETEEQKKVKAIKSLRKEIEKLEHSRLKHSTYDENRELNAKIKLVSRQILVIRNELRNDRITRKRAELLKNGLVSSVKVKQAKILKLLKAGLSFSNIIKHSEGVTKEEIAQVVEHNQEFIDEIEKINRKLPQIWLQWKKKFIIMKR